MLKNILQNITTELKADDLEQEVNFYRGLGLIIALLYPFMGLLYKMATPKVIEQIKGRSIFALFLLVIIVASYFNDRIKRYLEYIIYSYIFILSVHAIYLINLNWGLVNYSYSIIFILIVANSIIKNLKWMLAYNSTVFCLILFTVIQAGDTELNIALYILFVILTILISSFINYSEIELKNKLAKKIDEQKKIEDKLRYRVKLDKIITNLSTYFINLAPDEVGQGLKSALEQIGKFINADCSLLVVYADLEESDISKKMKYKWCNNKNKFSQQSDNFSTKDYPLLHTKIESFETVNYSVSINDNQFKDQFLLEEFKDLLEQFSIEEFVVLPLIASNRILGYLFLGAELEQQWSKKIIMLLNIAAEIFTNAIENRRADQKLAKYTLELELANLELEDISDKLNQKITKAQKLHKQFLGKDFPSLAEISFAAHYHPAERLGGDFYNVIKIDNKIITYIVDITGHGLDGAMLNIFVRESINSYLLANYKKGDLLKPGKIIEFIFKRYKRENFPEDYFICIMLGVLDLNNKQYCFVNQGIQGYPYLINKTGNLKAVKVSGLPISNTLTEEFFNLATIEEREIDFKPGDILIMTTDGLLEEESNGRLYGKTNFTKVLKEIAAVSAKEAIEIINQDFKEFSGSLQGKDDITILAVKREAGRS